MRARGLDLRKAPPGYRSREAGLFAAQLDELAAWLLRARPVLGIGWMDDGMPQPEGGAPPRRLAGRPLAYFRGLLGRARAHTRRAVARLGDPDLERRVTRRRRDGTLHEVNLRWVLYHMVEHLAGHCGQILLLRHHYRDARRP